MNIKENKIFDFNGEYNLARIDPKEDGFYMTIRCGRGGIYTKVDEFKRGFWRHGAHDGSFMVAYQNTPIPIEDVKKWVMIVWQNTENN